MQKEGGNSLGDQSTNMVDNEENFKGDDLEEGKIPNNARSRSFLPSNKRYEAKEGQNSPICTFKDHQSSLVLGSSFGDMVLVLLKISNPEESSIQNSNGILSNLDQNIIILDTL